MGAKAIRVDADYVEDSSRVQDRYSYFRCLNLKFFIHIGRTSVKSTAGIDIQHKTTVEIGYR